MFKGAEVDKLLALALVMMVLLITVLFLYVLFLPPLPETPSRSLPVISSACVGERELQVAITDVSYDPQGRIIREDKKAQETGNRT